MENKRQELLRILKMAKAVGYKTYIARDEHYCYGFIITENNILCIQKNDFFGWDFSFKYVPSHIHGSGCSCNDNPITVVTANRIKEMEQNGLKFATKLGAKRYKKPMDFFNNDWNKKCSIEV